jgi:hypothetical protein
MFAGIIFKIVVKMKKLLSLEEKLSWYTRKLVGASGII